MKAFRTSLLISFFSLFLFPQTLPGVSGFSKRGPVVVVQPIETEAQVQVVFATPTPPTSNRSPESSPNFFQVSLAAGLGAFFGTLLAISLVQLKRQPK